MKTVVFDLDGTLINSLDVWRKLDDDFLFKRGKIPNESYRKVINELPFPEACQYIIDYFGLDMTRDEVMREFNEAALYEYSFNIPYKQGAVEFVKALKKLGYKLAIATSSTRECCTAILKRENLLELFDDILYADECGNGKADPKFFAFLLHRLNAGADETVMYEDMYYSARTAFSSGIKVVGLDNRALVEVGYDEKLVDVCQRIITDYDEEIRHYI